jgi:hypothetical protein
MVRATLRMRGVAAGGEAEALGDELEEDVNGCQFFDRGRF